MLFSITTFTLAWLAYIRFADKTKFHKLYPTVLLAMYLASSVDLFGSHHYKLWDYREEDKEGIEYLHHLLQQLGIYPVVTYLFLQYIPCEEINWRLLRYIFYWTLLSLTVEWLAIITGNMYYSKWWTLGYSYLADWILFLIFFFHYRWRKKHESG
ncbi:CBO0543 family protein [Ammoniphilus sp. YIM 78166]|uniref:CBO0543 family protein n=1 Tax=Ammoniphilus sp. YIM 78166 TaxID=1644106 RepID=UPI0010704AF3|nr:CBO0543 family protein [Ammoniphilus sp. YIM 78166]